MSKIPESTAAALVLRMVRNRLTAILSQKDYSHAMNMVVNLDLLCSELQDAESGKVIFHWVPPDTLPPPGPRTGPEAT